MSTQTRLMTADEFLEMADDGVWTVDPRGKTVTIFRRGAEPVTLTEDQTLDGGEVLPNFACKVADLFV